MTDVAAAPGLMRGALEGVRVLDLTRIMAGPWSTQILADLGAEVIKIEMPGKGDDTRRWGPYVSDGADGSERISAYFRAVNRGKQSITVDMAKPEGRAIVVDLAKKSDIVIENYKVGGLARYKLAYADLAAINPRLVYCSITGFGQTGPYANRAGYDTVAQAMGGFMSVTGEPDGAPGGGPQRAGIPFVDLMTGLYATAGILAALRYRDMTGRGQHIDLGLLDVQVAAMAYFGVEHLATGRVQQRTGNSNPVASPSGLFPCKDGNVVLIVGNDAQFKRFCEVVGLRDLDGDARFVSNASRVAHRLELRALVVQALSSLTVEYCVSNLDPAGIACGPVNDLKQVFEDPQVIARGMVTQLQHPAQGPIRTISNPLRLSASPVRYERPPPMLGEHTGEVLGKVLGMSAEAIDALRGRGIIG